MSNSTIFYLIAAVTILVISMLVSLILTKISIFLLPRLGMIDTPDFKRHIHTIPTPRGGGIAITASFISISLIAFSFFPQAKEVLTEIIPFLLPLAIIVPLGIIDDKRSLKAGTKFLFQILAALLAWFLGVKMNFLFGFELPSWISCILTVFWIVALINAFNMIDGVDGLAGGIGCISALCMAIIAMTQGYLSIVFILAIFIGSLIGFLYYNWHPAKIFMGDTGSMFIGYMLAITGIGLNARILSIASIGVPLLACGIPVLDICLAIWRRIFNPEAIQDIENDILEDNEASQSSQPQPLAKRIISLLKRLGSADREHIHHRLLKYYHSNQSKTVWGIYVLAGGMGLIAIICAIIPGQSKILTMTLIIGTFSAVVSRLATLELWNSAETIFHNFHSARTGLILSHAIHPVFDLLVIITTTYLANRNTVLDSELYLFEHVTIIMVILLLSRNYRVFWNYSVSDDYFRLLLTLGIGYYVSWMTTAYLIKSYPGERFLAGAGVAIAIIIGERLFLHFFRNYVISRRNNSQIGENCEAISTVIYGINPLARLYRDKLGSNFAKAEHEKILGIISDDRRYTNSYCYGTKVLGSIQDLDNIYKKTPFQKIVLTTKLSEQDNGIVLQISKKHKIEICHVSIQKETIVT